MECLRRCPSGLGSALLHEPFGELGGAPAFLEASAQVAEQRDSLLVGAEVKQRPEGDRDQRKPAEVRQVAAVYTDCGAHTITAWPGEIEQTNSLLVYVSSYPLRPGPTCGDTEYDNRANPYDGDPALPANPLHGVIQVVEVPLDDPAESSEIAQPEISYPGDPDGVNEWCERGGSLCPPAFEPAAIACHDIVVHVEHRMAGAACAEQGQVWEIDPTTGIPDTANPMTIGDDKVTSGGTGQIPGAVYFFHSVMFNNDGDVVNWVDESFGTGCPTMTTYQSRAWNTAGGTHKTGKMFFTDVEGNFLSECQVGDLRPGGVGNNYCSAHMGMAAMGIKRDLLVNAWYTGGVDIIDFGALLEFNRLLAWWAMDEPIDPAAIADPATRALAHAMLDERTEAEEWLARAIDASPESIVAWDLAVVLHDHWGLPIDRDLAIAGAVRGRSFPDRDTNPSVQGLIFDIGAFRAYPADGFVSDARRLGTRPPYPWILQEVLP